MCILSTYYVRVCARLATPKFSTRRRLLDSQHYRKFINVSVQFLGENFHILLRVSRVYNTLAGKDDCYTEVSYKVIPQTLRYFVESKNIKTELRV